MPKPNPASVRFSSRCSTSTLASRCTVDFGIAVRDASSASVSSGSSALKQSSIAKTRSRTDLGATWCWAVLTVSAAIRPLSCSPSLARFTPDYSDQAHAHYTTASVKTVPAADGGPKLSLTAERVGAASDPVQEIERVKKTNRSKGRSIPDRETGAGHG